MAKQTQQLNIKIDDDELKGRYSNLVRVTHTREEFIFDFVNFVPPQGIVTARVVMSPGHVKRFLGAVESNLERHERSYGPIQEAKEPEPSGEVN